MSREGPSIASIAQRIEADVVFGRALPRERLVEDELIVRFGASRHGIRAALVELEQRGIVVRIPNRGAVVRSFERDEVLQISAVRDLLHVEAATLIPLPLPAADLAVIERLQRVHDAEVAAGDGLRIHRANQAFHEAFFALCGNAFLARSIAEYAQLALAFRCHGMIRPAFARRAAHEHHAMIAALRAGDRDALIDHCVAHSQPSRDLYCEIRGWPVPPPSPRRRIVAVEAADRASAVS